MAKATGEGGGGGGEGFRVIKSSGAILPDMDKALHLLPLAPNPSAVLKAGPPLERLPMGHPRPDRIAFTSQSSQRSWVASTHFFPAAYPRSHFAATAPPSEAPPASLASTASQTKAAEREQRKADFETFEDLVSRFSFESYYPPESVEEAKKIAEGLVREDQPPLWGSVQRIVPVDNGSKYGARDARAAGTADAQDKEEGLTLILAHANGFHKEIWETFAESLVKAIEAREASSSSTSKPAKIQEIWSVDCINSGDAGALNEPHLGSAFTWLDHPRDLLQFADYYLPRRHLSASKAEGIAEMGPVWPPDTLRRTRRGEGRRGRRIIGVGHSFSAVAMKILNDHVPDLFEGVIILDPVTGPPETLADMPIPMDMPMARSAVARKDVFASRKEAEKSFRSKPFFQAWHPAVLDLHLGFGLRPLSPGRDEVTLCMSKWSEAFAFSMSWMGRFAYPAPLNVAERRSRLHVITMSGSHATNYNFDGKESPEGATRVRNAIVASVAPDRGSQEAMEGDHLVVQHQPGLLGEKLADVLCAWQRQAEKEGLTFAKPRL